MKVGTAQFRACHPTAWTGRYARIPGDTTVFHLHYVDGQLWPVIIWKSDDDIATCTAIECAAAAELRDAVSSAKRHAGGDGGGAFLIDEFGRVIVPDSEAGRKRFLAGHLQGRLLFENPYLPEEHIHLGAVDDLLSGDPWKWPYVGMPYHLHRNGSIYFYQHDESGGRSIYPLRQDYDLIRAIRNVRPRGPVRILVTHAGIVLTKAPFEHHEESEESWQPVYVGSINPNLWFEKE